ncbi:MAG: hypothetical protein IJG84_04880 [Kiritimatiellae bacterium]|nr:hypothetical protein [Kiritimatiellia bacterium]
MAVAEYMELTGVKRNTATADLVALAKAGVVKRVGAGRGATYVLQKCTINAQNAQSNVNAAKKSVNIVENGRIYAENGRLGDGINEGITGHDAANEGITSGDNVRPDNKLDNNRTINRTLDDVVIEVIRMSPGINRAGVTYGGGWQTEIRCRRGNCKAEGCWQD